jgi:uncharacterized protein (TIGR02001 family)
MYKSLAAAVALSTAAMAPTVAFADDAPKSDITITGSADLTTQYRLRGISQTDNAAAIQGGITVSHASGFYLSTWASNLGGYGTFGGSNMELDLIGGFTKPFGPVTVDLGLIGYVYPGTAHHEYMEVYGSVSGKLGPVNAKLGTYITPGQHNVGGHNFWIYTNLGLPIPKTPITLKANAGYSTGTSAYTNGLRAGQGLNHDVFDYGVGADFTYKMLTLNVSFIGTGINKNFANTYWDAGPGNKSGHAITKGNVVATLTAAF